MYPAAAARRIDRTPIAATYFAVPWELTIWSEPVKTKINILN